MIRSPLALRLNPAADVSPRDQIREAARLGAKGVVMDAAGELAPSRLGETGRRDLRHLLRSAELALVALSLPTRRSFDTEDQLEDRLARADQAFEMAFDLGSRLVLINAGAVPPETEAERRAIQHRAVTELALRAEHRGTVLALETSADSGGVMAGFLERVNLPILAASIDPPALLQRGHDPVAAVQALGERIAHVYVGDSLGDRTRALTLNPRGAGHSAGSLDWEEYLGALEEVNYRGYVTIWPDASGDTAAQFQAIKARLDRF